MAVVVFFSLAGFAFAQSAVDSVQFTDKTSIIQSMILVVDETAMSFNIIAACDGGVKNVDIYATDRLLLTQPCVGGPICRMTGAVLLKDLPGDVITGRAECAAGAVQKERLRINAGGKTPRVYMVAALPYFTGQAQPVIAAGGGPTLPPDDTGSEIVMKGPELKVGAAQTGPKTYKIIATAKDNDGLDFLEILREKVFHDVQICKARTECVLDIDVTEETAETVNYQFKAMNLRGALSVDQITLTFTDKREAGGGEQPKEPEKTAPDGGAPAPDAGKAPENP